ncbi:ribosomal RNA-processing protein 7-domain-containing protein [Phlyctochytrium arcticum]|nr:ribosomal RNA-processing protein 7-domain-containing protein [Phlyctochytrium arcticum]
MAKQKAARKSKTTGKVADEAGSKQEAVPLAAFSNFRIIPLTVPALNVPCEPLPSFTYHGKCTTQTRLVTHSIFIRPHESRKADSELPEGRTLFVVNLPVDTSKSHLDRLFRRCGTIEKVVYKNTAGDDSAVHISGEQAHVVFHEKEALEKALALKSRIRIWAPSTSTEEEEGSGQVIDPSIAGHEAGLAKWIRHHFARRPPPEDLQISVDTALVAFDNAEREARILHEQRRNMPDEDGFVTVVGGRGRRNVNLDGKGGAVTAVRPEEAKKLKPKSNELVDFYRFQMREKKRNQLADLRKKFEEDKERIAALKANRRFKPY